MSAGYSSQISTCFPKLVETSIVMLCALGTRGLQKHTNILRSSNNDTANTPDKCANHDGLLTADIVGYVTRDESTQPGATGHGSRYAALNRGLRTCTCRCCSSLVEVAEICLGADDGRHLTEH